MAYQDLLNDIPIQGFMSVEDWNINSEDYDTKAEIRKELIANYPHLANFNTYDNPDSVAGYSGWIDMPEIGTVGFTHFDGNPIQYKW